MKNFEWLQAPYKLTASQQNKRIQTNQRERMERLRSMNEMKANSWGTS